MARTFSSDSCVHSNQDTRERAEHIPIAAELANPARIPTRRQSPNSALPLSPVSPSPCHPDACCLFVIFSAVIPSPPPLLGSAYSAYSGFSFPPSPPLRPINLFSRRPPSLRPIPNFQFSIF